MFNIKSKLIKTFLCLIFFVPLLSSAQSTKVPNFENGKWISNLSYNTQSRSIGVYHTIERNFKIFVRSEPNKNGVWGLSTYTLHRNTVSNSKHVIVRADKLSSSQYRKLLEFAAKIPVVWSDNVASPMDCTYLYPDRGTYLQTIKFLGQAQTVHEYDYDGFCNGTRETTSPAMVVLSDNLDQVSKSVSDNGILISDTWE